MIGNFEIKWLHDALALENCRSFTLAAEQRNISQSSFSRRIQSLESAIDFDIFDRSTNPLQLTKEGKSFIVYARNLIDDMQFQINKLKGVEQSRQRINIAAAHSLSLFVLPPIISDFSTATDNIFFVEAINVNETVHNLKEGKCDFILSFYNEELMASPFMCHRVLETELHLVSACDSNRKSLYALSDEDTFLMKYTDESYMGRQVNQMLDKNPTLKLKSSFVSSMSDLLKRMILSGNGVGWLPDYSIIRELENNELVILSSDYSVKIGVYLYRTNSRLNISSERFWQYMRTR